MRILQNARIVQNAYVVNDIDAAIAKWTSVMGAGPFFTTTHDILYDTTYRGRPATMDAKIAVGQAGDIQIEFIEVLERGPNVYHDTLPKGTEGFHHVAVIPGDIEAEIARYNAAGYETVARTKYGDDVRICFLDTYRDFGFMLELNSDHPFIREAHARIRQAAVEWDGKTRPSRPIDELFAE